MEQFVIRVVMTGVPETQAGAAKVSGSMNQMDAAAKSAAASTAASSRTLAQKWTGAGAAATAAGKKVNRGLSLPLLALSAVTGKLAVDFEREMRNVNSLAQLPERRFKRLSNEVRNLAAETGQMPKTLAEGLYDLVSSGFDVSEAMTILKRSAIAATAGLTTTEVSTKAVAATLNAYKRPASDAAEITDDLFQIVNLGVVTFDELATSIGYVLPAASTLGVDIKQVGASIATLTKEGQSSSNAVTNINAALTAFIKPSKGMAKALKELGYESAETLIRQEGFQGALEKVIGATDGSKEAIGDLFGNVRAMRAVFGLTGDNARGAAEDLRGFRDDAGATAKVFGEQSKSLAVEFQKLKAESADMAIEFGNDLIPTLRSTAGEVGDLVGAFSGLPPSVQGSIIKFALFGIALGPVLRIVGATSTAIGGIVKVSRTLAATDLAAGVAQAFRGDTAILRILGGDVAGTVVGGIARGIPIAIGAAGVVNILSSAIEGDGEATLYKSGGALAGSLIGGIAGSLVGNPLLGAAVGGGVGSFLGGLLEPTRELTPLQKAMAASSRRVAEALENQQDATAGVNRAQANLTASNRRAERTLHGVAQAERRLTDARKDHKQGSIAVFRAEVQLAEKRRADTRATRAQLRAEENLRFARETQGRSVGEVIHSTSLAVAVEEKHIRHLERRIQLEGRTPELQDKSATAVKRLADYQRTLNNAFERARSINRNHATQLEAMTTAQHRFGADGKILIDRLDVLRTRIRNLQNRTGGRWEFSDRIKDARTQLAKTEAKLIRFVATANPKLLSFGRTGAQSAQKMSGGFESLAGSTGSALANIQENVQGMMKSFGAAKIPTYQLKALRGQFGAQHSGQPFAESLPEFKAGGGEIMVVPGRGLRDTVPLQGPGINAMVAPGETLAAINRHQRPELDFAVAHTYGDRGLPGFFQRSRRPHYMAEGGIAAGPHLPEPRLQGPDPMRAGAQAGIHMAKGAAERWLEKNMGPKPGLGTMDGNPVSAWIIPILMWARAHGWGGSVNSGYRSPAEQIAAATAYGLGNYGSSGPLGSNHVGINYPRGAVDVSMPEQLAAILQGYPGKPNLVWGGPVIDDPVHFSATGHQRGGFILQRLAEGGFVSTSYGPPWEGIQGTGTTATGIDLTDAPRKFLVAVDPNVIPLHSKLAIHPNPFHTDEAFAAEDTGGAIDGKRIDFYDWRGRSQQLAWGRRTVSVDRLSGGGATKEETVPALFHGARTKALSFPPMPKSLHGVEREIKQRQAEVSRYRAAAKAAKDKPKVERAITANITALESRLKELRRERAKLRREAAKRKISRRLSRRLGKITGFEEQIAGAERAYEIANQYAEQLVGLEPQQPELPGKATDAEREAAEKKYVADYQAYIDQQERPAYGEVLGRLADWRNITLGGEQTATRLERDWERDIRRVEREIEQINDLTKSHSDKWWHEHPKAFKAMKEQRARLPVLRYTENELRKVLGEGREAFYPGFKNPIHPPVPPLPGSGSLEDTLIGIQGIHWPEQHSKMKALPSNRVAGRFGGAIWEAQSAIEELDLRIRQAQSGLESGGSGEAEDGSDDERLRLLEEQNQRLMRELIVEQRQRPVLGDFLGAYEKGGILPGTGFYLGHKGEEVVPANEVGQRGGVQVVQPVIHVSDDLRPYIHATVETRFDLAGRRAGQGRSTPSAPGRRANLGGRP